MPFTTVNQGFPFSTHVREPRELPCLQDVGHLIGPLLVEEEKLAPKGAAPQLGFRVLRQELRGLDLAIGDDIGVPARVRIVTLRCGADVDEVGASELEVSPALARTPAV